MKVRPVTSFPCTQNGLTLHSITGYGAITLSYRDETMSLKPGESRVNITRTIENRSPPDYPEPCTAEIITTDTIYNAGILEKKSITGLS